MSVIYFYSPFIVLGCGQIQAMGTPLGNRHHSHMDYRGGMDTGNLDLGGFPPAQAFERLGRSLDHRCVSAVQGATCRTGSRG